MTDPAGAAAIEAARSNPFDEAQKDRERHSVALVCNALKAGRVLLAYQPVYQVGQPERPAFYEGLARVIDPKGRIIPARDFIAAIDNAPPGRELDTLALRHGLETLRAQPDLRLSINMSAHSIGYPRWMRTLDEGLARDSTVGERLILEIPERSVIFMPDLVQIFMSDMQARGISFALDDFGAGLSDLKQMKELLFDAMKIHASLCTGIADDTGSQVLVQSVLALAHNLDMLTVVSGIERIEDAEVLARLGVNCVQGYCFGMPTIRPPWVEVDPRAALAG